MKQLFNILVVLVLLSMGLPPQPGRAQGSMYYVDPAGSDTSGDGSSAHPWQSIIYGATQLTAGDTLLINPGTYQGGVYVNTSGTAAEPVAVI